MKTIYQSILLILVLALFSCNTDIENVGYKSKPPTVDYAALKAYKQSNHEIYFGWFGDWTGGGAVVTGSLMSLPDSVDMVSNWGFPLNLTAAQKADMKNVRNIKGTKVLACIFTPWIGRYITPEGIEPNIYWHPNYNPLTPEQNVAYDPTNFEEKSAAVRKYAKALAEAILAEGYDGLDIDNETEDNVGHDRLFSDATYFPVFVEEVGKLMGPQSGTDKMLVVDGHLAGTNTGFAAHLDKYFNYFIAQAYNAGSAASLDSRFNAVDSFFEGTREELAKKFIVTENFESLSTTGGYPFTERDGTKVTSSIGMAGWRPLDSEGNELQKGGAGTYHIEVDYGHSKGFYYYTRWAIQRQNPAIKPATPTGGIVQGKVFINLITK